MGYYQGDFYAGARGDPGIGSFFKGLLGMGSSLIPGGSIVSKVVGAATAGRGIIKAGKGIIMKHPVVSGAGAAGLIGAAGVAAGRAMVPGGMCPKGHHISKKGKHAGACVRNRRMNPCNVHALRRASRRAHAFLRISRKLVSYYQPHKPKGKAFIRTKKKSK